MNMKHILRAIVVVVMLVAGSFTAEACKPLSQRIAENVKFVRVVDVTHLSTSGMNLYIEVDNDTRHKLIITEGEVDIVAKDDVVATISLRDKVVLNRNQTSVILLPLRFESQGSFALARMLKCIFDPKSDITLDYRVRAGVPAAKRTIKEEDIPVTDLLKSSAFADMALHQIERIILKF